MVLPVSNPHWIDKIIEERLLTEEIKITQRRVVEDLRRWFRVGDNNNTSHFTTAKAFALSVERAIRLYEPYPNSGSDELIREAKLIAQRGYNRVREATMDIEARSAIGVTVLSSCFNVCKRETEGLSRTQGTLCSPWLHRSSVAFKMFRPSMRHGPLNLGQIQDAEARLREALLAGAKGRRLMKRINPLLENNKTLQRTLPQQESDIRKEVARLVDVIRSEHIRLGEERRSLNEERKAMDFERRTSQAYLAEADGLQGKLRDAQGEVRTLQGDPDLERRQDSTSRSTPRQPSTVLHPADRDQAVEMLSKTTKELEKVTRERDSALLEIRILKEDVEARESKIRSLQAANEQGGSLRAAQEEIIRRLRERLARLTQPGAEDSAGALPPVAGPPPITSAEFPPVVFVDPKLPSLSSSLQTTPRSGGEEDDDDRGTLERLIDALTGRRDDEAETEHVLHTLERVVEKLTERCRVLETGLIDAKQELQWWRSGGGTATFNEAYAKVMAENERHLRLEGQRHAKEKSELRRSVAESETKRARYEELWRKSLRLLLDNRGDYLLGLYFHAWNKYSSLENGDREIGRLNAVVQSQSRRGSGSFQTPTILIQQCRSLQDEKETLKRRVEEVEGELHRHRSRHSR
ncbi:hypothetical protein FOZ61_001208 [Perkinsus olseni]|uniref:Uncharacterized protein n=1 Tax=Perkinsus olseni TaxID=32597 RepID=A0A7J6KSC2_PEROL|nr:hypothetical protein FOZ61_001208 [Perkinsus olseni]KAF4650243.1 hypothetical protein FOL46_001059 [Perkinsus olseni]